MHTIQDENESGLSPVDNWKITDYDHMYDMGFKPDGMYHFALKNPPMTVCHKKGQGFILNDESKKEKKTFSDFNSLTEYFSKYEQEWESQPYR